MGSRMWGGSIREFPAFSKFSGDKLQINRSQLLDLCTYLDLYKKKKLQNSKKSILEGMMIAPPIQMNSVEKCQANRVNFVF